MIYALVGGVWIVASDAVLMALVRDRAMQERIEVYKGWAFILTTALLLFGLLRAQLRRWADEVTRREQAESVATSAAVRAQAYVEQLRKLSQAVEHSTAGIMIVDKDACIEYVNPRFTQMTGYTLDEVRGQNPRLLKSGETSREDYARLWAAIKRGDAWHGEFHNRRKDGTLYWEQATIAPIVDDGGAITHYLGIKDDVTDRKSLEAQFRQAQKMEVIGTLAGGIAHDFNNLLTVILSSASLLTLPDVSREESAECAQQIQDAAERAAMLTRQLLLFSRKQAIRPVVFDAREAVASLASMLRRIVGENVAVETAASDAPLRLRGDAGMFDQVLMNLTVNARDAMPTGGRLTLRTSAVTLGERDAAEIGDAAPGPYVVLEVSDTGVGISPSIMPRIFEPFFTTKEAGHGTGLGLATVYGIAKQHKGWVTVRSTPGEGTTFRVGFPSVDDARVERRSEIDLMHPGEGIVLVVEDDAAVRASMVRALRQCGYTVLEAASGAEALTVWRACVGTVALLLTDLVMPQGLGGVELAAELRARDPALRVLFTSGYDPDGAILRGASRGERFLQKPFSASKLSDAVRAALE